jgi:hypothetical protein
MLYGALLFYGALLLSSGFLNHWPNKEEVAVNSFPRETITTSDFMHAEFTTLRKIKLLVSVIMLLVPQVKTPRSVQTVSKLFT